MATLTVGSGKQFSTIASAVAASRDGDTVAIDAGTYTNDFATINKSITLQGVGGMARMIEMGGGTVTVINKSASSFDASDFIFV